jgi:hypothetical protein
MPKSNLLVCVPEGIPLQSGKPAQLPDASSMRVGWNLGVTLSKQTGTEELRLRSLGTQFSATRLL